MRVQVAGPVSSLRMHAWLSFAVISMIVGLVVLKTDLMVLVSFVYVVLAFSMSFMCVIMGKSHRTEPVGIRTVAVSAMCLEYFLMVVRKWYILITALPRPGRVQL